MWTWIKHDFPSNMNFSHKAFLKIEIEEIEKKFIHKFMNNITKFQYFLAMFKCGDQFIKQSSDNMKST